MASSRRILGAGGGGFGTGLVLLIGGLVVKHSQEKMVAECSTGLGQFGQVIDPNVAKNCSTAQALSSMATGAIWIGAIILAIAVGGFVAFLIASGALAASRKPKVVVPAAGGARPAGTAPAAPARPNPAGGAVLRPIVPVVVGQEDSPLAYPAGSGCGHELNGARFCTVCGRPAADNGRRDVFAAEPAVSASGAEITTVLPVLAPAEPADLAAPAMVPSQPAEWSLATVASGSQMGRAARPPVPAPVGMSADRPSAPGPFGGLADRPSAPGPFGGLADRPPVSVSPAAPADRLPVPGPLTGPAGRPPVPAPATVSAGWPPVPAPATVSAGWPPVPAPASASAGWPPVPAPATVSAGWPPVPAPASAGRPPVPAPVAASADRPPAPRGAVSSAPPWGWADPPPAPGSTASSVPPWAQAEPPPAAPEGSASSGPPWDLAERLPAPSGAKLDADGDGTGPRQSGRHRSRRP
jgi:hypothetical protein